MNDDLLRRAERRDPMWSGDGFERLLGIGPHLILGGLQQRLDVDRPGLARVRRLQPEGGLKTVGADAAQAVDLLAATPYALQSVSPIDRILGIRGAGHPVGRPRGTDLPWSQRTFELGHDHGYVGAFMLKHRGTDVRYKNQVILPECPTGKVAGWAIRPRTRQLQRYTNSHDPS